MKKSVTIFAFLIIFSLFFAASNNNNQVEYSDRFVSYDSFGNITYHNNSGNYIDSRFHGDKDPRFRGDKDAVLLNFIENGFPVQTMHTAGTYHGGPAVHTLIANVAGDTAHLEIVVSGLSTGPLYAFNSSGQLLSGWPVQPQHGGAAYQVFINNLVITANWGTCSPCLADIAAFNGAGQQQWSHTVSNYVTSPPSAWFLNSISDYGVFNEEEDFKLHGYRVSNGNSLTGWPYNGGQSQEWHTPAIADIDNDGQIEIISASSTGNGQFKLIAVKENGTIEPGWSNIIYNGHVDTYPAIGDVDGDGQLETVIITTSGANNFVKLISPNGTEKRSWQIQGTIPYGTAPALADLNSDGIPEIIVQAEGYINVTDGFGVSLPGWPVAVSGWMGNSSPVVGDIDGDQQADIVFVTQVPGSSANGFVHVLKKDGSYVNGWQAGGLPLPIGSGAVPAIADIDNDGHNEIIITGSYWNGSNGNFDKVWAFDMSRDSVGVHHGSVQWGQFGHDAQHTGHYITPIPTGINISNGNIPSKFNLFQNYPNPFNPNTEIKFAIPPLKGDRGMIALKIYDILGKEVATLVNKELKPGSYEVNWNASNYPSGVYFYKLNAGDYSETRRMILLK